MATSGTYSFAPRNASVVQEAFQRIGKSVMELSSEHLESAIYSIQLILADWMTRGIHQYRIEQYTETGVDAAETSFTTPDGTLDVLDMVRRETDGNDFPMGPISRQEYLNIPDKNTPGTPVTYFVEKARGAVNVYIYPAPETSTDDYVYNRLVEYQDAGTASQQPDIKRLFLEALHSELAARLAEKWNNEVYDARRTTADAAFERACVEDRERAQTEIIVQY